MSGAGERSHDKKWNASYQSVFDDLKNGIPSEGIDGLTPHEVLKHIITKHNGNKTAILEDVSRWLVNALELNVWKKVGGGGRKEEETRRTGPATTTPGASPRGRGAGKAPRPTGRGASTPAGAVPAATAPSTAGEVAAPTEVAAAPAARSKSSAAVRGAGTGAPKGKPTGDAPQKESKKGSPQAAPAGKAWGPAGSLQEALKQKQKEKEAAEQAAKADAAALEKASAPAAAAEKTGSAIPEGRDRFNNVRKHPKNNTAKASEGVPPPAGGEVTTPEPVAAPTAAPKKSAGVWGQKGGVAAVVDGKAQAAAQQQASPVTEAAPAVVEEKLTAPAPEPEPVIEQPAPAVVEPAPVAPAPTQPAAPAAKVLLGRYAELPESAPSFGFGVAAAPSTTVASSTPAGGDVHTTTSAPSLGLSLVPLHASDLEAQQLAAAAAAAQQKQALSEPQQAPLSTMPVQQESTQPQQSATESSDQLAGGRARKSSDNIKPAAKPVATTTTRAPAPAPAPAPVPAAPATSQAPQFGGVVPPPSFPGASIPAYPVPGGPPQQQALMSQMLSAMLALQNSGFSPYFPMPGFGYPPTDPASFASLGMGPSYGGFAAPTGMPPGPGSYEYFQQATGATPSMGGFSFPQQPSYSQELGYTQYFGGGFPQTSAPMPSGATGFAPPSFLPPTSAGVAGTGPRTGGASHPAPGGFSGLGFPGSGAPTGGFEHSAPAGPLAGGFDASSLTGGQAGGMLPQAKGTDASSAGYAHFGVPQTGYTPQTWGQSSTPYR